MHGDSRNGPYPGFNHNSLTSVLLTSHSPGYALRVAAELARLRGTTPEAVDADAAHAYRVLRAARGPRLREAGTREASPRGGSHDDTVADPGARFGITPRHRCLFAP